MKIAFCAAATIAALISSGGTASAQYPAVVPHHGHYHVAPTYSAPYVSGYGYPAYSPGVSFGLSYSSPGYNVGGAYSSYGYGGGYYSPGVTYGHGSYGHYQHHVPHHHGHHR